MTTRSSFLSPGQKLLNEVEEAKLLRGLVRLALGDWQWISSPVKEAEGAAEASGVSDRPVDDVADVEELELPLFLFCVLLFVTAYELYKEQWTPIFIIFRS